MSTYVLVRDLCPGTMVSWWHDGTGMQRLAMVLGVFGHSSSAYKKVYVMCNGRVQEIMFSLDHSLGVVS